MAKITTFTNVTLDGVYQAPGRADEDTRGGFAHGGWATAYNAMSEAGDILGDPGELLFGRWTFELFRESWGKQKGNPFSDFFNATTKHVVTRNANFVPGWENSSVLSGDTSAGLQELKSRNKKDLLVFGSGNLVASLVELGLVDRYVLLIHPLLLGSGKAFGSGLLNPAHVILQEVRSTKSGVLIATYSRGA